MNNCLAPRGRRWARYVAFAVLSFSGCSEPGSQPPAADPAAGPRADAAASAAVQVVDRAGYDAVLADLQGKVVLVDFWATWCAPCVEQLPHTVSLAEEHGADLAVVTVCMDDPEEADRISELLTAKGAAATTNLICQDGSSPRGMEAFEIDGGALPHYKLYDQSGALRQKFALDPSADEQFTADDVAAAVDALLSE